VIRGRSAFRCKHRWFGPSSRCRSVWSVRTLSTRQGILWPPHGGPYWLVTVSSFQGSGTAGGYVTCFPFHNQQHTRAVLNRIRRPGKRKRPRQDEGAAGDVVRHRCDTDHLYTVTSARTLIIKTALQLGSRSCPSRGANQDSTRHRGMQQSCRGNSQANGTGRAYRRFPTWTTRPSTASRGNSYAPGGTTPPSILTAS